MDEKRRENNGREGEKKTGTGTKNAIVKEKKWGTEGKKKKERKKREKNR